MSKDQLLSEIERQQKYLAELPKNFSYPLFNTKRALDSQRQNGVPKHGCCGKRDHRQRDRSQGFKDSRCL